MSSSSDIFELVLILSIIGASTILNFVSQERMAIVTAHRMFTIVNVLMACIVWFYVDYQHVARLLVAVLGPTLLNAVLVSLSRASVQKRRE